jgi:hypothetical protein
VFTNPAHLADNRLFVHVTGYQNANAGGPYISLNKSLLGLAQIGWLFLIGLFVRLRSAYSDESFNCTGCSGTLTGMRYPRVIDQIGKQNGL